MIFSAHLYMISIFQPLNARRTRHISNSSSQQVWYRLCTCFGILRHSQVDRCFDGSIEPLLACSCLHITIPVRRIRISEIHSCILRQVTVLWAFPDTGTSQQSTNRLGKPTDNEPCIDDRASELKLEILYASEGVLRKPDSSGCVLALMLGRIGWSYPGFPCNLAVYWL